MLHYPKIEEDLKILAQQAVHANPELVQVIYECPCKTEKKVLHHFSYIYPYMVLRLCEKCHRAEHARLNAIANGRLRPQKTNHDSNNQG